MTRRQAPLQVNQFTGGLNTELSPLQSSGNTTKDELNMELTRSGIRVKRLGFNYELGRTLVDSGVTYDSSKTLATSMFRWENAGGDAANRIMVVQVGNALSMHDLANDPASSVTLFQTTFASSTYETVFSYAVVDGLLVVATGLKDLAVFEYDGTTITESTDTLFIRDLFGVQAFESTTDLTLSQNIETRPATLEQTHIYNLRNQGYSRPFRNGNGETLVDMIDAFYSVSGSTVYPSNADNPTEVIYADANDSNNRLVERFFANNLFDNPPGNTETPKGYFVIDALERGTSRLAQEAALLTRYSQLTQDVTTLPTDRTPGGPKVVEGFAGRVWYAGFSGEVEGGDSKSPLMSSYVLFSQLIKDKTDVGRCYQNTDPTSGEDNALVDTDGGFIRIDGAYNISSLVSLSNSLFVFAENGVWIIRGSEDSQFVATGYEVERLTNKGCEGGNTVVLAENRIFYWSRDSIYVISRNEFAVWEVNDLTEQTIKTFYLDIPEKNKQFASGYYDSYQKQVRWVYSLTSDTGNSKELTYSLLFSAFTPNEVAAQNNLPKVVAIDETEPYTITSTGDVAQAFYLVISSITGNVIYSFGTFWSPSLIDWENDLDLDYNAFLVTSALTGGEPRGKKNVPYLHTYFERTESGFEEGFEPINESSCLLSAQWNWTDNAIANKWTTPRQAYRYQRSYTPIDSSDTLETGQQVISTRNRIRGQGRAVSFKFDTEPRKNLRIYGWSFDLQSSNEA